MKHSPFAGAASFAHLIGLRPRAKTAEDEDNKPDTKKGKKAEEEQEDSKAKDDDKKEEEAEDEDDAAAEQDDEEKTEDEEDDTTAKGSKPKGRTYADGRAAERKRCAAIFAAPEAAGQPHVAARLAFTTNLSAKEAIGVLAETASSAPQGKRGLGDRMATVPNPNPGADGGSAPEKGSAAETIARMTAVYDRATGASGKK